MPNEPTGSGPNLKWQWKSSDTLVVTLTGDWRTDGSLPGLESVANELTKPDSKGKKLEFDTTGLTGWGSRFVTLAARSRELCRLHGVELVAESLPEGVRRLIRMSEAVPEKKDARREAAKQSWLEGLGEGGLRGWAGAREMMQFLG